MCRAEVELVAIVSSVSCIANNLLRGINLFLSLWPAIARWPRNVLPVRGLVEDGQRSNGAPFVDLLLERREAIRLVLYVLQVRKLPTKPVWAEQRVVFRKDCAGISVGYRSDSRVAGPITDPVAVSGNSIFVAKVIVVDAALRVSSSIMRFTVSFEVV